MPEQALKLKWPAERPLPEGVRDLLFADAAAWRGMEAALRRTWTAWGYREIILPTFEYADTLATDVGAALDAEMYRFFDRHGRTLALRPDMTIPTARVVGTRLYDQPMPLRLAMSAASSATSRRAPGRQHEFTQAGVELIGAAGTRGGRRGHRAGRRGAASRRPARLPHHASGTSASSAGCSPALGLPERRPSARALRGRPQGRGRAEALLRRDTEPAARCVRRAVLALPRLAGDASVLAEAEAFCLNATMMAALADLRRSRRQLAAYGVTDAVSYDLAEVRDLDYYTGVTFEGFAPGLGFSLISGGRYDDLIGHFGPPFPAVGWALTLDRVLLARELQGFRQEAAVADVLLFARTACADCLAWAAARRARSALPSMLDLGQAGRPASSGSSAGDGDAPGHSASRRQPGRARRTRRAQLCGRRLGGGGSMAAS